MKIVVTTDKPFAPDATEKIQAILEKEGFVFEKLEKYTEKLQLLEAVKEATGIIIRSDIIDEEVMQHAPHLKIIVRAGAGYDNVDIAAASARNICVMNTPGQNANAVAELVFGLLLCQQRNHFDGSTGREIKGRRLGLFAFGYVAKKVAKIAAGFQMPLYSYSLIPRERNKSDFGVTQVDSATELFENSDIVSLHMPLIEQTRQLINYNLLAKLPNDGIVINTARKEVINEDDLMQIMEERPNFQYITDIKPDKHDEFTAKFPKTYFATPKKTGAQTEEANYNAGVAAAEQIVGFLKNGDEKFRVN